MSSTGNSKFKSRWFFMYSRIMLPILIIVDARYLIYQALNYSPLLFFQHNALEPFLFSLFTILCHLVYIGMCIRCIFLMIRQNPAWKKLNTAILFLLPVALFLNTFFLNFWLSLISPGYATPIFPGFILIYVLYFYIFSLPTLLILRNYTTE